MPSNSFKACEATLRISAGSVEASPPQDTWQWAMGMLCHMQMQQQKEEQLSELPNLFQFILKLFQFARVCVWQTVKFIKLQSSHGKHFQKLSLPKISPWRLEAWEVGKPMQPDLTCLSRRSDVRNLSK